MVSPAQRMTALNMLVPRVKGHGAGHDPEVQGGVSPHGGIRSQKGGQGEGQGKADGPHEQAEEHGKAQALPHHFPGVLLPARSQVLGHLHGKAYGSRGEKAVEEPGGAGGQPHGGGGLRAQRAHHGGVHVLHQGDHDLLHNGGPGQQQHRGEGQAEAGGALLGEQGGEPVFLSAHTS